MTRLKHETRTGVSGNKSALPGASVTENSATPRCSLSHFSLNSAHCLRLRSVDSRQRQHVIGLTGHMLTLARGLDHVCDRLGTECDRRRIAARGDAQLERAQQL